MSTIWQRDVKPKPALYRLILEEILALAGATPIAELLARRSAD